MDIGYAAPLQRAWARSRGMLLKGASLETWFVLGFTAWLARLWDNAGLGVLALLGVVLGVAAALISFWTDQFIVPVMYRDGTGALGLATCCIGWLVLAIPYLGTVILLPVYVTARALGPEFLAQYGAEWRL
jgi:hypothetical protein